MVIRLISTVEKSMVAICLAAAPPGAPLAAVATAMVGSSILEKAVILSSASLPIPIREWTSATEMAVMASASTSGTT